MSSEGYANDSQPGPRISVFKSQIHEIEPILALEDEWQVADIPDADQPTNSLVMHLRKRDHVQRVDRGDTTDTPSTYRWVPESKAVFEAYVEKLDTLPCGHRAHIPPEAGGDTDTWPCKFCGETFARDVFENRL